MTDDASPCRGGNGDTPPRTGVVESQNTPGVGGWSMPVEEEADLGGGARSPEILRLLAGTLSLDSVVAVGLDAATSVSVDSPRCPWRGEVRFSELLSGVSAWLSSSTRKGYCQNIRGKREGWENWEIAHCLGALLTHCWSLEKDAAASWRKTVVFDGRVQDRRRCWQREQAGRCSSPNSRGQNTTREFASQYQNLRSWRGHR